MIWVDGRKTVAADCMKMKNSECTKFNSIIIWVHCIVCIHNIFSSLFLPSNPLGFNFSDCSVWLWNEIRIRNRRKEIFMLAGWLVRCCCLILWWWYCLFAVLLRFCNENTFKSTEPKDFLFLISYYILFGWWIRPLTYHHHHLSSINSQQQATNSNGMGWNTAATASNSNSNLPFN